MTTLTANAYLGALLALRMNDAVLAGEDADVAMAEHNRTLYAYFATLGAALINFRKDNKPKASKAKGAVKPPEATLAALDPDLLPAFPFAPALRGSDECLTAMALRFAKLEATAQKKWAERRKPPTAQEVDAALQADMRQESKATLQGIFNYDGAAYRFMTVAQLKVFSRWVCTHPYQALAATGISMRGGLLVAPLSAAVPGLHSGYLPGVEWLRRDTAEGMDIRYGAIDIGGDKTSAGPGLAFQSALGAGIPGAAFMRQHAKPGPLLELLDFWATEGDRLRQMLREDAAGEARATPVLHELFKQVYLPVGDDYLLITPMQPPSMLVALGGAAKAAREHARTRASLQAKITSLEAALTGLEGEVGQFASTAAWEKECNDTRKQLAKARATYAALPVSFAAPPRYVQRYGGQQMQNVSSQAARLKDVPVLLAEPPVIGDSRTRLALIFGRGFFGTRAAQSKDYRAAVAAWEGTFPHRAAMENVVRRVVRAWLTGARDLRARAGGLATPSARLVAKLNAVPDAALRTRLQATVAWLYPELRTSRPATGAAWQTEVIAAAVQQLTADLRERGIARDATHADIRLVVELLIEKLELFK